VFLRVECFRWPLIEMHVVGSAAGKGLSGPKATEALTGSKKRLKVFSVSLRAKREFTRM